MYTKKSWEEIRTTNDSLTGKRGSSHKTFGRIAQEL